VGSSIIIIIIIIINCSTTATIVFINTCDAPQDRSLQRYNMQLKLYILTIVENPQLRSFWKTHQRLACAGASQVSN
jgi:hypothetical protein